MNGFISEAYLWIQQQRGKANLKIKKVLLHKSEGIDGILVTVGLCIIALILCVVMKDSLQLFIKNIVTSMSEQAQNILKGATTT
ncbi:MAG: hypothetical protein LBM69_07980 [Lachnospiraceae bacterium]|jgi:hypothetical protein|nr:hypothetical protein [Lachnospiraceae bacterium]